MSDCLKLSHVIKLVTLVNAIKPVEAGDAETAFVRGKIVIRETETVIRDPQKGCYPVKAQQGRYPSKWQNDFFFRRTTCA